MNARQIARRDLLAHRYVLGTMSMRMLSEYARLIGATYRSLKQRYIDAGKQFV